MKKTTIITSVAIMTAFLLSHPIYSASEQEAKFVTEMQSKKGEVKTVVFHTNLHCENCVKKVKENISFEKGVKALEVSLKEQTIRISFDARKTSEEKLAAAIRKLGYAADRQEK